ncbi:hypothetical protein [Streptomyces sp. NBC_01280]
MTLARASVWRLLTRRLGWSLQRPRRQALGSVSPITIGETELPAA